MTKVFGIKEPDFFTFIKKINEFYSQNKVFATQTHIDYKSNFFYAVIYFEPKIDKRGVQPVPAKIIPPTKEQLEALKFYGIKEVPKSKSQAWEIINKIKGGVK